MFWQAWSKAFIDFENCVLYFLGCMTKPCRIGPFRFLHCMSLCSQRKPHRKAWRVRRDWRRDSSKYQALFSWDRSPIIDQLKLLTRFWHEGKRQWNMHASATSASKLFKQILWGTGKNIKDLLELAWIRNRPGSQKNSCVWANSVFFTFTCSPYSLFPVGDSVCEIKYFTQLSFYV